MHSNIPTGRGRYIWKHAYGGLTWRTCRPTDCRLEGLKCLWLFVITSFCMPRWDGMKRRVLCMFCFYCVCCFQWPSNLWKVIFSNCQWLTSAVELKPGDSLPKAKNLLTWNLFLMTWTCTYFVIEVYVSSPRFVPVQEIVSCKSPRKQASRNEALQ